MRFLIPLFFLVLGFTALADNTDNMIPGGGFEAPAIKARTAKDDGGDPSNGGRGPEWIGFAIHTSGTNGAITGGLTNEVARTGTQSLFIHFDHVNGAYQAAVLTSNFIPVASGTEYEVGIWGRTDAKAPIDANGRSAYLKVEVDYFAKDANESVGETSYAVQPLPGSRNHDPFFKPDAWNSFHVVVTTPPEAVFAQIIWRWETGSDPGETNGTMYFDDATMTGPAPKNPHLTPEAVQEETPAPETTGTEAATPAPAQ